MPVPERPQFPSPDPRFRLMRTDDGSRTLVDAATGDSFHSGCGAAAECRHVYLENSGVADRLRTRQPTSVLEVGFGTGMSLVLTAAEALRWQTPLHYVALEQRPLSAALLRQVLLPTDSEAASGDRVGAAADGKRGSEPHVGCTAEYRRCGETLLQRLEELPPATRGSFDLAIAADCTLQLLICDARDWQPAAEQRFDAIYFDPFSPASNPRLWELPVLQRMISALQPQGRLVSYCVSRVVRDRLQAVGFRVARVAGPPGGKREVLVAHRG